MLRWLSLHPLVAPATFAALFVGLVWFGFYRERQNALELGKWSAIAKRLQADSAQQANVVRRVDSVFTRDTIRLTRTVNRFRTRIDSLTVTDTLTVREQVIVAAADTAIKACLATVTTCEQRVAARDSLIRILGQQRGASEQLYRAKLARANPRVLPYAEALIDPLDAYAFNGRVGLELRLLGAVRLVAAAQYLTPSNDPHPHPWHALAGVRVTF